jgi:CRISPR/Cas system-associated exonuclease Cas4 (RecB family)
MQFHYAISQTHLNIWETCQRKYQHKYLEDLSLPEADPARLASLLLGSNFHLLMQQMDLGLDVSVLAQSDPKLQDWLDAFNQSPPQMIEGDRLCEHRRTWEVCCAASLDQDLEQDLDQDVRESSDRHQAYFVLTAIYDLLILGEEQAQILDWKTHQKAIAKSQLEHNWQTRLYLYLLAKTTNYPPEQLSMTYWFANGAESVKIPYKSADRDRTERDIKKMLTAIAQAQVYPQIHITSNNSSKCKHCEFNDRCDRAHRQNSEMANADINFFANINNITEIPEIAL